MNKKIITACAAALLMAACAGAWLAYHHANPKTDRLEFEYGDPLDIEAETLIRSPDPAIADTVEIDLSAIEREEDGTAAAGNWDASFTYTDVFGTHTCPLTICISDTAAPSFLKLPERITLAPGNADHDFSAGIEIWDLSECSLEIDSSMVDFDQPGEYILFATAVDRYDNQRSRSIRLTISEAQDTPAFIASSETVTDIDPVLQRMVEAYLSAHAGDQEHWSIMVMDAESAAASVSVNGRTVYFDTEDIEFEGWGPVRNELGSVTVEGVTAPAEVEVTWYFRGSYGGTELETITASGTVG